MSNQLQQLFHRRNLPAWVILIICLGLLLLEWQSTRSAAEKNGQQQFELHVRDVMEAIETRMRQHEQILLGGAGLFDASASVEREEWRAYVERLNLGKNYPGIQGLGFSKLIPPSELQAHVAAIRAEGFADYSVRPPGERDLYTAIIYLEPFAGRNLAAFGFDMMSEATRAKAMRRAAESGQTAISGKVKLVQETHGKPQAGFLMYLPIYHKNLPLTTAAERWNALSGFVYSPYRVNDLMQGIMGEQATMVDFTLYDGAAESDAARMYDSVTDDPNLASHPAHSAMFSTVRTIESFGQRWTVRLHSHPAFEARFSAADELPVLALGGVASVLLFTLVSFLISRRDRAEELAQKMTAEIRHNQEVLRESAQRTQAILDNVADGIITIDDHGKVQSFNRAAETIFGYSAAEVIGGNIKMLMPEPYHSQHDGYLDNYRTSATPRIIGIGREVEGRRKDGATFPMDLAVSQSSHQRQPLFIGLVRDITERRRIDRMKNEFISTVSHELRTPLTAIRGALGLVNGGAVGALPEQARTMLTIASKNTERLLLLINDILDMQKIESGQMVFRFEALEVMPFVEQALEDLAAYGQQYQVHFVITQRVEEARLLADRDRLVQVMSNLLSNAAKFSPAGATVGIAVSHCHDNRLRISVSDSGPGIPAEFHHRIFQKFSQADSSDSRQKGGTGLGLAICRELIERMHGTIGFESEEGEGSCFYFELPLC